MLLYTTIFTINSVTQCLKQLYKTSARKNRLKLQNISFVHSTKIHFFPLLTVTSMEQSKPRCSCKILVHLYCKNLVYKTSFKQLPQNPVCLKCTGVRGHVISWAYQLCLFNRCTMKIILKSGKPARATSAALAHAPRASLCSLSPLDNNSLVKHH